MRAKERTGALLGPARENCAVLGKEYCEIEGGLAYFERLVAGPYDGGDFVVIRDGGDVREEYFL